jgi:DNA-binding NarL/FixJ family response regulator
MEVPTGTPDAGPCVLLGIRHRGLGEGIRDLLAADFDPVVVLDEDSLAESAERLRPPLAVVDLSLGAGDGLGMLRRLHHRFPALGLIVLGLDDEPTVLRAVLAAGADRLILASAAASELLPAADAILGERHHERRSAQ